MESVQTITQRLTTLLLGSDPALEELLRQSGVIFKTSAADCGRAESSALYILCPGASSEAMHKTRIFLEAGGAVLAPKSASLFPAKGILDVYDEKRLEDFECDRSAIKTFSFGTRYVRERVALYPKKALRDYFWGKISGLYRRQGLFCPRLSFYPEKYRSLFTLRVDADEYDKALYDHFFETSKIFSSAVSIFFCISTYREVPEVIRKTKDAGFDVTPKQRGRNPRI